MPSSYSCPHGNPEADADSISGPQRFSTPSVRHSLALMNDEQTLHHHNTGHSPKKLGGYCVQIILMPIRFHMYICLLCLCHPVAQ